MRYTQEPTLLTYGIVHIYFNVTLYNLYPLTTHMFDIIITLGILLWKGMLKMQPYYVHFLYIYIKHSLNTLCNA